MEGTSDSAWELLPAVHLGSFLVSAWGTVCSIGEGGEAHPVVLRANFWPCAQESLLEEVDDPYGYREPNLGPGSYLLHYFWDLNSVKLDDTVLSVLECLKLTSIHSIKDAKLFYPVLDYHA